MFMYDLSLSLCVYALFIHMHEFNVQFGLILVYFMYFFRIVHFSLRLHGGWFATLSQLFEQHLRHDIVVMRPPARHRGAIVAM